jgi:hypothetical protein
MVGGFKNNGAIMANVKIYKDLWILVSLSVRRQGK